MCGFVGIHHADPTRPAERDVLARMLSTISYRGPDGTGFYDEASLGFGFRRLAIIDPEGGDQPLSNEERSLWIVFNGEIYNYRELAAQLQTRGYRFRTHCDTETIIHAYAEWGESCVEHLRGIFAFAIWDRPRRRLFLARDRSGIKPLHLSIQPESVYFASEAKAILASGTVDRKLDLVGYLGGDEIEPLLERTAFRGVVQLGAGCSLSFENGQTRLRRYWEYQPSKSTAPQDTNQLVEQFGALLHETVGAQLVADVPVAASLSGGVDSAAVVASVVRHHRLDVRTYTVAFDQDHTEDLAHARIVAAALGIHTEEVPCETSRETAALIPYIGWVAEGEFDLGYIGRFQLARAVYAAGAKVLLTGQGIDEILTGYYPSYTAFRLRTLGTELLGKLHASYRGIPSFAPGVIDAVARELTGEQWAQLITSRLKRDHWRLGPGLLRFEDRMGMAGHVEVRVPLLDHHLLEFCASLSETSRQELFSAKGILRRAVASWLPPEITGRRKVGFNLSALPLTKLLLTRGGEELTALIGREATESKGYFDWAYCQALMSSGDFFSLDHVFIIHLLDDLFVSSFAAERFAQGVEPTPVSESALSVYARGVAAGPEVIPRLSPSVARVATVYPIAQQSAGAAPDCIEVQFAEATRQPARLAFEALDLIRLIDGVRTYDQLAREMIGWTADGVLAMGEQLQKVGVIEHLVQGHSEPRIGEGSLREPVTAWPRDPSLRSG